MIESRDAEPDEQRVAAAIRWHIESGEIPVGARIPTEAQIAAGWSVSRGTARQATALLRSMELVTTMRGRGTFVRDRT